MTSDGILSREPVDPNTNTALSQVADTVYVIDDLELCRVSMQMLLESSDYSVLTFATPTEFLGKLDAGARGCIILDYSLPTMTGLELVREVRSRGCSMPFIVVTGYGTVPLAVEFMQLGAITVLEKPYMPRDLLTSVRWAIAADQREQSTNAKRSTIQSKLSGLTKREMEVLEMARDGMPSKQIAKELGISTKTVEVHRFNILKKLEIDSMIVLLQTLMTQDRLHLP